MEVYVRELVPALARLVPQAEITVVANAAGATALRSAGWPSSIEIAVPRVLGLRGLRAASEATILGAYASSRFDALFSPAMTAPLVTRAANVVMVPDLIWLTDLEPGRAPSVTDRLWRAVVPPTARRADRVVAFTEFGARDIESRLRVPRDRIDVVGSGFGMTRRSASIDEQEVRGRFDLGPGPIVLSVAAKNPHKNLLRLIGAMRIVRDSVPDAMLVMPGPSSLHEDELRARVQCEGLESAVRLPGFVEDDAIEALYAAAVCVAVPSLREGFGMPLLEAMNRGVPVVAADASCLPEVAGSAAVLVDPFSEEAIAGGIVRVLQDADRRAQLIAAGHERCTHFSWDRCSQGIMASLTSAWAAKCEDGA